MNFLHDKHSRYYCIFIVTLVLLLFLMGIAVIDTQTAATKEMFLTHNNAIATSLLEEGISKEVIATALMNTEAGTTGNKFLAEIGLSNSTDIENLPYVSAVKNTILTSLFVMLFLWTLLLFLGTMLFLYRRERLYRESENIIKDYIDGNYTVHLPQSNEGTIYQLLSSVDQLATMLQAKNDAELLQILSECEPNIIVITGDLVDAEHTDIDVALDFAKEAVQIADTYYVTGNHEASLSQYDELKAELENTGVVVLEDKAMQLEYNGDDITLIGLSDPSFTLKGDMFGEVPAMVDTKLRGLIGDKDNYTILLSHRPELFEAYVNCGVDLVLSGHAHGGQFRLPFIGGLVAPNQGLFPKYDAGLYTKGDTNMIVCRGLGNSIIPIRFNNRPEIVLLELIAE